MCHLPSCLLPQWSTLHLVREKRLWPQGSAQKTSHQSNRPLVWKPRAKSPRVALQLTPAWCQFLGGRWQLWDSCICGLENQKALGPCLASACSAAGKLSAPRNGRFLSSHVSLWIPSLSGVVQRRFEKAHDAAVVSPYALEGAACRLCSSTLSVSKGFLSQWPKPPSHSMAFYIPMSMFYCNLGHLR